MPNDLDIIQQDVLANLQQLSLLQQLEVLHFTENLVKESKRTEFDEKIRQLDEWTKSLIGLIPTDDVTDELLKREYQNYLEQKYQLPPLLLTEMEISDAEIEAMCGLYQADCTVSLEKMEEL